MDSETLYKTLTPLMLYGDIIISMIVRKKIRLLLFPWRI